MPEINDYCPLTNKNVTVAYHTLVVPVLGKGNQTGSAYIDECSCSDSCTVRTNDCPVFRKLNHLQ